MAERFPDITVIHGDATSLRVLEEERVGSADYFVAATNEDEDKVMTCIQTGMTPFAAAYSRWCP
ncbi:MAG: NAD-binding protein [Verrucomicrobia bacterium]|nr:NAD-binding protein [Verrucomicrobiota bacterium]